MKGIDAEPHTITFFATAKPVLKITPEGRFLLGEGATADDAAKAIVEIAENRWRQRLGGFSSEDVAMLEEDAADWDDRSDIFAHRSARLRSLASRIKALLPQTP